MSIAARITLDDYHQMIARGRFEPREEHRLELLNGELSPMSPVSPLHRKVVQCLTDWSYDYVPRSQVSIGVQAPITLVAQGSEPEPDLTWIRKAQYPTPHPPAELVLLLVEVSGSSLAKDLGEKLDNYAEAGVQDYWIVDIEEHRIETCRDPCGKRYARRVMYAGAEEVHPLAFPEISLRVSSLFE